jgi:hypothetical protein
MESQYLSGAWQCPGLSTLITNMVQQGMTTSAMMIMGVEFIDLKYSITYEM